MGVNDNRSFNDKEIRKIISRALEIQKRESDTENSGTSLQELEEVGRELGIKGDLIRKAAAELEEQSTKGRLSSFLGGNSSTEIVEHVQKQVNADQLQELTVSLPGLTGAKGNVAVGKKSMSWNTGYFESQTKGYSTEVHVSATSGSTEIRIKETYGNLAAGLFGGLIGGIGAGVGFGVGAGVGIGVFGSPLFLFVFASCSLTASYFLARVIYRNITGSRKKKLKELVDQVRRLISQ